MHILIGTALLLALVPALATGSETNEQWDVGLYCESVFPDKRLNNFFIINNAKTRIQVASFNDDRVSFVLPPLILQKTPDELVNRKSGLSLNRKNLEMKWRNQKSKCRTTSVAEIKALAEDHLQSLLNDNKI